MSLEQALQENTAAIKELIAALNGAKAASAAAPAAVAPQADTEPAEEKKVKRSRKAEPADDADDEESKPKYTFEQAKAAAVKVKDTLGAKVAKELIKTAGKAAELAELKPENYGALIAACEKALKEADESSDDDAL